MTTLQLARAIADAVLVAGRRGRSRDDWRDGPTQAVLRTLERRRSWFMRFDVEGGGIIKGGTERPYDVPTPTRRRQQLRRKAR